MPIRQGIRIRSLKGDGSHGLLDAERGSRKLLQIPPTYFRSFSDELSGCLGDLPQLKGVLESEILNTFGILVDPIVGPAMRGILC